MKTSICLTVAFTAAFSYTVCMAQSENTCPSTFHADFCEQVKGKAADDLISFSVVLQRGPVDTQQTDPKKDSSAPDLGGGDGSQDLAAYTQKLFGTYDLRWPEDTGKRATAPSQPEGTYRLYATKATILALGAEDYVQEVERWSPEEPIHIMRPMKTGHSSQFSRTFNAMGQQITGHRGSPFPLKFQLRR